VIYNHVVSLIPPPRFMRPSQAFFCTSEFVKCMLSKCYLLLLFTVDCLTFMYYFIIHLLVYYYYFYFLWDKRRELFLFFCMYNIGKLTIKITLNFSLCFRREQIIYIYIHIYICIFSYIYIYVYIHIYIHIYM